MSDDAFETLLRSQPSAAQRELLHEARRAHALDENDALWGLLQVVEDYCASIRPSCQPPGQATPPAPPGSPAWVFQPWQWACAGLACQTLALAAAFFVGCNWGHALPSDTPWVRAMLSVPAGWMMFILTLPVLVQGAWTSWRMRSREGLVGWCLLALFLFTIASCALALWWLLL